MRIKESLGVVANIAVIALVAFTFLRPTGVVGAAVVRQYRDVVRKRIVAAEWPAIAKASRVDSTKNPVAFVEFADYECPACRRQYVAIHTILNNSQLGGLAYRHRPLAIHPRARGAARAAICAEKQGRFVEMHHQLFTTDRWMEDTNWVREAVAAGVRDTNAFVACHMGPESAARLEADVQLADRLRIDATPTFIGMNEVRVGMMPDTTYSQKVRMARK